jgi:hypothetical protein
MSLNENETYVWRAYCDICNHASPWKESQYLAKGWRDLHFESLHDDNPMVKQNCRIQRDVQEKEEFAFPIIAQYNND